MISPTQTEVRRGTADDGLFVGLKLVACLTVLLVSPVIALSALVGDGDMEDRYGTAGVRAASSRHRGHRLFTKAFRVSEGLGPRFNAVSCLSCHNTPLVGGSGNWPDSSVVWTFEDTSDGLGSPAQRFALT